MSTNEELAAHKELSAERTLNSGTDIGNKFAPGDKARYTGERLGSQLTNTGSYEVAKVDYPRGLSYGWLQLVGYAQWMKDSDFDTVGTYVAFVTPSVSKIDEKPTNPKQGMGSRKVSIWSLPMRVLMHCALGMMAGGYKYGLYNYREMGVLGSTYQNAALRHMTDWWEGMDYDKDAACKVHNLDAAINCLLVMRDSMLQGNFQDDRPIKAPKLDWMDDLNKEAANMADQYPDGGVEPFTETKYG